MREEKSCDVVVLMAQLLQRRRALRRKSGATSAQVPTAVQHVQTSQNVSMDAPAMHWR